MKKDLCGEDMYRRITVDIDILDEYEVANALKVLKENGFDKKITLRLSPSGKGYHIIAWSDKGVPLRELLKIREQAGDDPARIWFDSMTHREINVLFDNKRYRFITMEQLLDDNGSQSVVRYNTFYETYDDMERVLKEKGTWLSDEDFRFLKSLYLYKVIEYNRYSEMPRLIQKKKHGEILQHIFMEFLKYFNIKKFVSHNKIQIEQKTFKKKNLTMLFHIMPLTRGEYLVAIRKLVQSGKIKRKRLNNHGRGRYYYEISRN